MTECGFLLLYRLALFVWAVFVFVLKPYNVTFSGWSTTFIIELLYLFFLMNVSRRNTKICYVLTYNNIT